MHWDHANLPDHKKKKILQDWDDIPFVVDPDFFPKQGGYEVYI